MHTSECCSRLSVSPPGWASPPGSIPVSSLPPLEWPMPGRTDQYELHIDVQPKPHHRAHYETEGSRGAVKAPTGGHPVVQVRPGTLIGKVVGSRVQSRMDE